MTLSCNPRYVFTIEVSLDECENVLKKASTPLSNENVLQSRKPQRNVTVMCRKPQVETPRSVSSSKTEAK